MDTKEADMATERALEDRITQDPAVMVGKPVVRGTRIPVERVIAHLANNTDLDDLLGAYPELTIDVVKACLRFANAELERRDRRAARRTLASGRTARA
jgi:uncharacterized protein (DUF433 family)